MGSVSGEVGGNAARILSRAWFELRLSCRAPERKRPWDAIVLTATSPAQADLYLSQLEAAKQRGHIADQTLVLAVPDAQGKRIGSGGATLGALRALSRHLQEGRAEPPDLDPDLASLRVLVVHAGGDSKRVPWANPIGKPFIPFALLADEDPDGPPLTLFDHILAMAALTLDAFQGRGGCLMLAGDVLGCFDATRLQLPEDGAVVVTAPVPLDVAGRHGVIVGGQQTSEGRGGGPNGGLGGTVVGPAGAGALAPVVDLLQKPSMAEVVAGGALFGSGKALLDSGIFAVCGATWRDLVHLATQNPDPLLELLAAGDEISLYEEVAGAWVPARHAWVRSRPLGDVLVASLSGHQLYHFRADDLTFLHCGTSGEILDHLRHTHGGVLARRHLSAVAAPTECSVAPSAVLVASEVLAGASVGEGSLVSSSRLTSGTRIGTRCVVVGVDTFSSPKNRAAAASSESPASHWRVGASSAPMSPAPALDGVLAEAKAHPFFKGYNWGPLVLPSNRCLWQVPLAGGREVTACCGVDDNPKDTAEGGGTFCGLPWAAWLQERGVWLQTIWPEGPPEDEFVISDSNGTAEAAPGSAGGGRLPCTLWRARLFPIVPRGCGLPLAMWLMGVCPPGIFELQMADTWRQSERTSLAELHELIDFEALRAREYDLSCRLITGFATASIASGSLLRNFAALNQQLLLGKEVGRKLCATIALLCPPPPVDTITSSTGPPSALPLSFDPKTPVSARGRHKRRGSFHERVSDADVGEQDWTGLPASRVHQACLDLLSAAGLEAEARAADIAVWAAVAEETAAAVCSASAGGNAIALPAALSGPGNVGPAPAALLPTVGSSARVELPVRLDVAGGWSDTPPWSLERVGRVLNLAVRLGGANPVGASVQVVSSPGVVVEDETGAEHLIEDPSAIPPQLTPLEPLCLVKAALLVTGLAGPAWHARLQHLQLNEALHLPTAANGSAAESTTGEGREGRRRAASVAMDGAEGHPSWGLRIRTWAAVPQGSGLGTSSILAAALVKALLLVLRGKASPHGGSEGATTTQEGACTPHLCTEDEMPAVLATGSEVLEEIPLHEGSEAEEGEEGGGEGEDATVEWRGDGPREAGGKGVAVVPNGEAGTPGASWAEVGEEEVSRLVLVMEQRMGTGGGWQDQVGGLYPGIKHTTSLPTRPLRLLVDRVPLLPAVRTALESHIVVAFTGQVRLARNVLQKVVTRYLQRDARLIAAIDRLAELASAARDAITTLDLRLLGEVVSEAWRQNQELDPHCSNAQVDCLFRRVEHLTFGYKLVGAGGGGFAMFVARSKECAEEIKRIVAAIGEPVKVYDWSIAE